MFNNPSLITRIAIGKTIGYVATCYGGEGKEAVDELGAVDKTLFE